jgi:hypothetical protein
MKALNASRGPLFKLTVLLCAFALVVATAKVAAQEDPQPAGDPEDTPAIENVEPTTPTDTMDVEEVVEDSDAVTNPNETGENLETPSAVDEQLADIADSLQQLQDLLREIQQAETPEAREELLQENLIKLSDLFDSANDSWTNLHQQLQGVSENAGGEEEMEPATDTSDTPADPEMHNDSGEDQVPVDKDEDAPPAGE